MHTQTYIGLAVVMGKKLLQHFGIASRRYYRSTPDGPEGDALTVTSLDLFMGITMSTHSTPVLWLACSRCIGFGWSFGLCRRQRLLFQHFFCWFLFSFGAKQESLRCLGYKVSTHSYYNINLSVVRFQSGGTVMVMINVEQK